MSLSVFLPILRLRLTFGRIPPRSARAAPEEPIAFDKSDKSDGPDESAESENFDENYEEKDTRTKSTLNHIMRCDPTRRFTSGLTVEDTTVMLWVTSRMGLRVSEPFDFVKVSCANTLHLPTTPG